MGAHVHSGPIGAILLVLTAAALGCGGRSDVSSCDGGCWNPSSAQQVFIGSFCELSEACCVSNARKTASQPQSCAARLLRSGVTADPALQSACLTEMRSLSASKSCLPEVSAFSDPCVRTIYEPSGPQGPGAPCHSAADCTGKAGAITFCATDPSALRRGICLQMTLGREGDHLCLGDVLLDGAIFSAAYYPGSGTPISVGVLCERSRGLRCAQLDSSPTPGCVRLFADGATCQAGYTCASGTCVDDRGTEVITGDQGTCAKTVADGQACGEPLGTTCAATSFCTSDATGGSVCAPRRPVGATCTEDRSCQSGTCAAQGCSSQSIAEVSSLSAFCSSL